MTERSKAQVEEAAAQRRREAAAFAVGLLNQVEATCSGWVLQFDKEWVAQVLDPLYSKLDEV